ncbi:MAG TPA: alpha/beta hydrolase, partial [Actinomycetota bacterium]|nr:alpha/beta hydrolase [Actinomycetota bacterium]
GTFLAQVVANVFPDRTGALLLDAVVDPAWASGPAGTISWAREHADQASWSTLRRFFRLCDQAGRERCSFAAGRPQAKYAALAARLRHDPIHVRVPGQGRQVLGYPDLVGDTLSGLYNSFKWPLLADLLQAADVGDRRTLGRLLAQLGEPSTPTYDNYRDVGLAITCGDTDNPGRFGRYAEVARTRDARVAPYFGSIWAYHPMVCAAWTGRSTERYTGPWTPRTTQPVLLITSRHDPATPYRNARKVARLIPNSALITVDGVGHGGLFASSCAARLATRYLLTRATPEPGTRCKPDITPFGAAAPSHRPVAIPQALQ